MHTPAYIALGEDGHVTLYWGDGTEEAKHPILQGPRPTSSQDLLAIIQEMKAWAEENGYVVVVPSIDLEAPDIKLDITEHDAEILDEDEVIDLLTDVLLAEDEPEDVDEPDDETWY
jgi:hypothetical protein